MGLINKNFLKKNFKFLIFEKFKNKLKNLIVNAVRSELRLIDFKIQDISKIMYSNYFNENIEKAKSLSLISEKKIAYYSADYMFPKGTLNDDTRCPAFVIKTEEVFGRKVNHLDLGCSGGGLVFDFNLMGNFSLGIEGSDTSKLMSRAQWKVLPSHLHTADITKEYKFVLREDGARFKFDIITAWEVMEHISKDDLPSMIKNVYENLVDGGIFACSIAEFPDYDPLSGVQWHVTLENQAWWLKQFEMQYFEEYKNNPYNIKDFPRGSGNQLCTQGDDWNAHLEPEKGFHLVLKKINKYKK